MAAAARGGLFALLSFLAVWAQAGSLVLPITARGVVLSKASTAAQKEDPQQQCGQSGYVDWLSNIPAWKAAHPGVDGFCYFQNFAPWFVGISSIRNFTKYGQDSLINVRQWLPCHFYGEGKGPIVNFTFDMGTLNLQLDHCTDRQDDPYCYSFGWLRNQRLDSAMMANRTAWKEVGKSECKRLQRKYQFLDEEVTVGRHVTDNVWIFRKTLCAITGGCERPTARDFAMHVYTKCQLGGDVGMEMAYCQARGCLLPGNRIRHGSACPGL